MASLDDKSAPGKGEEKTDYKEVKHTSKCFKNILLPIASVSDFFVYFGLLFRPWFSVKFLLKRPRTSLMTPAVKRSFLYRPEPVGKLSEPRKLGWGWGCTGGPLERPPGPT